MSVRIPLFSCSGKDLLILRPWPDQIPMKDQKWTVVREKHHEDRGHGKMCGDWVDSENCIIIVAYCATCELMRFYQLFLFVPIEDFLLFCHWFVKQRVFPSESASGPPWTSVDVFISIVGNIARIQVDMLDSVVLRSLRGRRRVFRVSLFDGRFLARVLT
ncbi:hypothetical protein F2Q70_00011664 [Brassica cretica]|uniref:Uncharacterized protein n=1 Tax=Brassica cretica TaxID=69181 RepID=A0A8S9MB56_BRACR|nr:hypothetical protein F2Q70_00011664 [Brassica cretica]